jgi:hypothetical protein
MFDLSRKVELKKEGKADDEISAILKQEKAQILDQLKKDEEESASDGKMEIQEEAVVGDAEEEDQPEPKSSPPETPKKTPGKRGRPRKQPLPEQPEVEEESSPPETPKSSSKKRLTKTDVALLEDYCKLCNYTMPTKEQKQELADKVRWTTKGVHQWFLRRIKTKPSEDEASAASTSQKQALPVDPSPKKLKTRMSHS